MSTLTPGAVDVPFGIDPFDPSLLMYGLDRVLGADEHPPYLVVVPARRGARPVLAEVPGDDHPVDLLIGWTPSDPLSAVGVVACGTAHAPNPGRAHRRVRVTHLTTAGGTTLSLLRDLADGTTSVPEAAEGRVVDVCRRVLGLPTETPRHPFTLFAASVWLDRLLAEAAAHPERRWTWAAVARLHPMAPTTAGSPHAFAEDVLATCGPGVTPWAGLHGLLSRHGGYDLTPEQVAWMDVGAFSRWAMAATPDLDDLVRDLQALLPEPIRARIREALAVWGLG